jgi:hypothetical protein
MQGRIQDLGLGGGAWVWEGSGGPLKVPQRVQDRALVGGPGGRNPPKLWGFEELQCTYIYLNDNFEPTTPFLSDQKKLYF